MANFQTVFAWILENNSVVARALVVAGTFNVASAGIHDNLSESIHFAIALGPERNPALVREMLGRRTKSVWRLEGPDRETEDNIKSVQSGLHCDGYERWLCESPC